MAVLRLSPDAAWAATPRELIAAAAVLARGAGPAPLRRAGLAALLSSHPDEET